MLAKTSISFIFALLAIAAIRDARSGDGLQSDFRIRPTEDNLILICRVVNESENDVFVPDLLRGGNTFGTTYLHEPNRRRYGIYHPGGSGYRNFRIRPEQQHVWQVSLDSILWPYGREDIFDEKKDWYRLVTWRINHQSAQTICLGVADDDGNIRPPVVNPRNPNVEMYLGLVFHEWHAPAPEMCFLFLNGTSEDIRIYKPLSRASRIVVSAPDADYDRELYITEQDTESVLIGSGKVSEWRLPWQTVYSMFSEDEVARIRDAGGNIDMTWETGGYQSTPLPLSLAVVDKESTRRLVRPMRHLKSALSLDPQVMLSHSMLKSLKGRLREYYEGGYIAREQVEQSILWAEEYLEKERDRLTPDNLTLIEGHLRELLLVRDIMLRGVDH